ncbi:ABC transporter substrate-binding protein [Aeromicrobium wangtongii]|uniref:ABC transporter substrate-binding protein n=1 Tax=Aeromicrobium wangtongii TaxID=2969247 RepID=UPI00201823C2|nr:ABC transporter substrate-binding protein [Aeromicrobium wangtongii]MCL3819407.1 ABC transporter substrate-binding protein [Aeromicrobium wangtongii]
MTAAALLLVSACGSSSSEGGSEGEKTGKDVSANVRGGDQLARGTATKGGSLTAAVSTPIESLDPTQFIGFGALTAAHGIYGQLMKYADSTGAAEPDLAESLTTDDYVNWTLTLREGVNFTDGTPLNADAVIAHLKRYTSEGATAFDAGSVRNAIKSTVKKDDLTVELTTNGPNYEFAAIFTGQAGMVPSPKAVEADPTGYAQNPVGAGSFKVKSFKPGGDMVLEANQDYYDAKLPHLDELKLTTVPDSQTRLSGLKAGDVDIAALSDPNALNQAAEDSGLTVLNQSSPGYYVQLNLSSAPFEDERVRQALLQAIDIDALTKAVFDGRGEPFEGWFLSANPYKADVEFPKHDVEAAEKLVAEYEAEGGDASFTLQVLGNEVHQRMATLIQQMLKKVGIAVKIDVVEQPVLTTSAGSGTYQAQMRSTNVVANTNVSTLSDRYDSASMVNYGKAGIPAVDAILKDLRDTVPTERTQQQFTDLQQALAEWIPTIPLSEQNEAWVVKSKVGGFPGSTFQGNEEFDPTTVWAQK